MQIDATSAFGNNQTLTVKWSKVNPDCWDPTRYMPEINADNGTLQKTNKVTIQKAQDELLNKKDSHISKKAFYIKWSEVKKDWILAAVRVR